MLLKRDKAKEAANPRIVKVGFEKDKAILRATVLEKDVKDLSMKDGITFIAALHKLLGAKRFFYVVWRRRHLA